jgi:hypothetical protein
MFVVGREVEIFDVDSQGLPDPQTTLEDQSEENPVAPAIGWDGRQDCLDLGAR